MKYRLSELEEYCFQHLPIKPVPQGQDWPCWLSQHKSQLLPILRSTRRAMLDDMVSLDSGDATTRYIHAHGQAISTLIDRMRRHYSRVAAHPDRQVRAWQQHFYYRTGHYLAALLMLLKQGAPASFDRTLPLPFTHFRRYQQAFKRLRRSLGVLQHKLDAHTGPVIDLALAPIVPFLKSGSDISIYKGAYLMMVLSALSRIEEKPGTDINFHVHFTLITYNFNDPDYIDYCNYKLAEKVAQQPAPIKLDILLWYNRELQELVPHPDLQLHARQLGARFQLQNWVHKQIIATQPAIKAALEPPALQMKFLTNFSVDELGLLGIILQDLGYARYGTKSELFDALVQIFTTKGTDVISKASLSSKAFNPSQATIARLIELFLQGVQWLRKR